ncbi:MAG: C1 family peptidase [bacterium]|nr:C1 family peptidase [bacterium]
MFFSLAMCQMLPGQRKPPLMPWEVQMHPIETNWAKYDESVPIVIASVAEDMPVSHTIPGLLAPGDQGSQSSGAAWAVGYAAFSHAQRHRRGQADYICSPAAIFNRLNRGRNQAVSILATLQLLEQSGCPHEKYMPYRENDYVYQPGRLALEDAERYRVSGYGRVDYQDLEQVKAHIYQGSVVILRLRISENFVNHRGREWRVPAGQEVGSQTLAIVGYDEARGVFILQNSAGGEWGEYGRTAIPYHWFIRLAEKAYILW